MDFQITPFVRGHITKMGGNEITEFTTDDGFVATDLGLCPAEEGDDVGVYLEDVQLRLNCRQAMDRFGGPIIEIQTLDGWVDVEYTGFADEAFDTYQYLKG